MTTPTKRDRPGRRILVQTRGDIAALWPLLFAPFRRLRQVPAATWRVRGLTTKGTIAIRSFSMRARGWNAAVLIASGLGLLMTGCGGGGTTTPPPPTTYVLTVDTASPASGVVIEGAVMKTI